MDRRVGGFTAPGFEGVRDAFAANLNSGEEIGAAFAVVVDGEPVVDLHGGVTVDAGRPLSEDALFSLWSTSKGLAAVAIAKLVDLGRLAYEAPVTRWWPEFAANGKGEVTVAQLLSHQAGLCGPDRPVSVEDYMSHRPVAEILAAQAPFFPPGSAWGYHALSYGVLANELALRSDGRGIGEILAAEIAGPFGLDAYLGLPASLDNRHLTMRPPTGEELMAPDPPNHRAQQAALANPPLDASWTERRDWRAAGLSSAGGVADARSLARLYCALVGGAVVSPGVLREATRERVQGPNQINGVPGRYAAGFMLNLGGLFGPGPDAFGHPGWGGSMAFADPAAQIGVAYVTNRMRPASPHGDPRSQRLIASAYDALRKLRRVPPGT